MNHLRSSHQKRYISFVFVYLVSAWVGAAQIQNGQITGIVADSSGAIVPGAKITARNPATGYDVSVQTNEAGIYTANELTAGIYIVLATAQGFKTAEASDLVLNAGTVLRVDFKLPVGDRSETIEVTDAAAAVNIEVARLAQTVDSNQIANLPLNGRNVYDLIQYAPGATNVRGVIFENGANTVVNGVRENFNGFLMNGLSNKGLSGGPVNQPIQDTVQEFQLLTLNNSAEFGNSAGAITNLVTKSGTNALHGSTWEYFRNDALDANPFFANHDPDPTNRIRTPLHFNQFGGTLGGPIKKNKLFFFAAFQGDRFIISNPSPMLAESPEFRTAVNSAFPDSVAALLYSHFAPERSGSSFISLRNFVNQGLSGSFFTAFADYLCPAKTDNTGNMARKFAKLFGVEQSDIMRMNLPPDQGGCNGGSIFSAPVQGVFSRDASLLVNVLNTGKSQASENLFNGNEASLRLDYNLRHSDRLFAEFNWARSRDQFASSPNLIRGFSSPSETTTPNVQMNYMRALSPTMLNEFRAGYSGNRDDFAVALPGVPNIFFDDGSTGFGSYSGYPQIFHENVYTYSDMISINHGRHNIRAGAEARRNMENSDLNARPSYNFYDPLFFAIDAPYSEAAGVDPGIISGTRSQLATNIRHWRNWELGTFVQDDWRVSKGLTLNLGLRYDLYTRLTELNDLATTFLKGPGEGLVDNITTGAGQIKDGSSPCPGNPLAAIAGACGPEGFAPAKDLGTGDHNNFGPRLGFAWDVFGNGKTSIRGAFGISYEGTLYGPLSLTRWNLPYYSLDSVQNFLTGQETGNVVYGPVAGGKPTYTGPAPQMQHSGNGAQATGNISGWDSANPNLGLLTGIVFSEGIRDPYVENWFLGIQREIRRDFVVEIDYVSTAGRKLYRAESVNRIPGGRLPEATCTTDNFGRKLCSQINTGEINGIEINPTGVLNPNYGRLRVWENAGNSNYEGLQVSVKKLAYHGLQLNGNYTYSHAIDSGSGWHSGAVTANGFAAGDSVSTDFTQPSLDRGNSTFDIRQRLAMTFVWEIPFYRRSHGFPGVILGGWQANGIWSLQTGAHWSPFNERRSSLDDTSKPGACQSSTFDPLHCVNVGGDYNLDGEPNDRPNAVANHVNATHDQWANGFNLPNGFFSAPCLGCTGDLGRNSFVGPGYWAADLSIFKTIRIAERLDIQFRTEAFNLFNHTNFELGDLNHGSKNEINNPQFGQAGTTGPPRNLQLGLKLTF
jgi:outer membrane receptor protein involved in Fe transport